MNDYEILAVCLAWMAISIGAGIFLAEVLGKWDDNG